jgi:predicted DNA-binding transcriptional regulator AlpA
MKVYSTRQAAKELGISFPTLNRYIGDKKIPVPPVTELGTARVRVWSEQDIETVRQLLPKIANGRKTRYKKQSAAKTKTPPRAAVPHKKREPKKK